MNRTQRNNPWRILHRVLEPVWIFQDPMKDKYLVNTAIAYAEAYLVGPSACMSLQRSASEQVVRKLLPSRLTDWCPGSFRTHFCHPFLGISLFPRSTGTGYEAARWLPEGTSSRYLPRFCFLLGPLHTSKGRSHYLFPLKTGGHIRCYKMALSNGPLSSWLSCSAHLFGLAPISGMSIPEEPHRGGWIDCRLPYVSRVRRTRHPKWRGPTAVSILSTSSFQYSRQFLPTVLSEIWCFRFPGRQISGCF